MKIAHKLVLAALVAAILIGGVGFYAGKIGQRTLKDALSDESAIRSAETLEEIERRIRDQVLHWRAYARSSTVQAALRESNLEFEAMLDPEAEIAARNRAWVAQGDGTPGPLTLSLLQSPLSIELRRRTYSFEMGRGYPVFPEIFLTNRYGAVLALNDTTSDYRQDDEEWWQRAVEEDVFVGECDWDESANSLSVELCLRITEESGELLGVMKTVYSIREIVDLLNTRAQSETSALPRFVLINASGMVIHDTAGRRAPLTDASDLLGDRPQTEADVVSQSVRRDPETGREYLSSVASSARVRGGSAPGWQLLLEYDTEDLFQPLKNMNRGILAATAVATLLALILSMSFSRSMLRPINALIAASRAIGKGDLKARAEIQSVDEFALLGASFNQMASALDESMQVEIERGEVLQRYSEKLEDEILERKRIEKDLIEASELAQQAARAKSDFLANMSHEIRTPMNGIMGVSELLLDSNLENEQREYCEMIHTSAVGLLSIINDILDFSKIEAGKLTLDPTRFNLYSLIEDSVRLFVEKLQSEDVELVMRYAPDAPRFFVGDPGRLRQILLNLLGNAIKFTESGYVFISVEVESAPSDRAGRIHVSVEDTGIGIPKEKIPIIFGKFEQADTSTTRRFGGTGLGLAITRQLIELMDGSIHVTSGEGEGTTVEFEITLPLAEKPRVIVSSQVELEGLHVMVVDDQPINRRVIAEQLHHWGMQCTLYESAAEALQGLKEAVRRNEPYDLAILDYQMPEMDGEELAREISRDPELSSTVMIMLSSCGHRGEAAALKKVGISAYLSKPVGRDELLDTVKTVWGSTRGKDEEPDLVTRHTLRELRETDASKNGRGGPEAFLEGRVLLAEDNAINQKLATRLLERMGLQVDLAVNGKEVLQKFNQEDYKLILIDCQMPEMDGYEATREIRREEPEGKRIPIVALTASAMQGDRERCMNAGMDDYITKPIRAKELRLTLERWLGTPSSHV